MAPERARKSVERVRSSRARVPRQSASAKATVAREGVAADPCFRYYRPMSTPETPRNETDRHIREAEERIARQEALVAKPERRGNAAAAKHAGHVLSNIRQLRPDKNHRRAEGGGEQN